MKLIIRLIGGLGNQLFQLQYGMTLQNSLKCPLLVDDSFLAVSKKTHESVAVEALVDSKQFMRLRWFDLKIRRTFERVLYKFGIKPTVLGQGRFHFENETIQATGATEVIVDGFWQGASYLDSRFVALLQEKLLQREVAKVETESVCVHVRRGDYLTNRHWFVRQQEVAPISYYQSAFAYFRETLQTPRFEIYTDDELWASETFGSMPDVVVVPSASMNSFDLLTKMACYPNYVIANSTLSWWAAVASSVEHKQVVLPKSWGKDLSSDKYRLSDWVAL